MSDLIDRQVAIGVFLTELTKREQKNLLHTWSTVEVKYFVADMLEKIPSAQPEQRWIPVTERLPEKGSFALVTDFGDVEEAYYDSDGYWWQVWGDRLKNVTAWMPLPEPYRKEADNAQLD